MTRAATALSIARNPVIAAPMFLASYAEKAGSGPLNMIARFMLDRDKSRRVRRRQGRYLLRTNLGGQEPQVGGLHQRPRYVCCHTDRPWFERHIAVFAFQLSKPCSAGFAKS